jgi:hypothetical protein
MPSAAPAVADEQIVELLGLLKDADTVELKLTVAETNQRSAIASLGLDPLDAQIRLVHFFDTLDLDLDRAGVVVRTRRVQGKGDDTVVKLRPVVPETLPARLRRAPGFGVEVDATPDGFVASGSMKGVARGPVRETLLEGRPLRKLFTKPQRALFEEHAPDGIGMDDLTLLGPIFVLKLKGVPEGLARKLVGEMWLYPDGTRILELSTKCMPAEAFQVAAELRGFLAERGIAADAEQRTKTRQALGYFSEHPGV